MGKTGDLATSDRLEVAFTQAGRARLVRTPHVLIATGAMERPMPVPGWTLPGVMTVGAAQTILKSEGLAFEDAVFAGTGPLLYLAAAQYIRAGMRPRAILDTTPVSNRIRALRYLSLAFDRMDALGKGLTWMREIRQAGVPVHRRVRGVEARGDSRLRSVTFRASGMRRTLETDHLLLHQGVVPNTQLALAAGCAHRWDPAQLCWRPELGDWFETTIPGIRIAGDGGGIEGAEAAEHQGRLAGLAVLADLGLISMGERDTLGGAHLRAVALERQFRPFLETLYRPADAFRIPQDPDTIVCRCEEVTAGEIRQCARLGCQGPNQLKAFCRAGMGPCQGRMCSLTVAELIADERGTLVPRVGYLRPRPPIKPMTLGELAEMAVEDD
jgi:NADPH-dependent 2,4-dienoyl-CoA reductase/sulfur reductase-like enzyme